MRAVHLTRRFFGALSPAAPRADDLAWVESVLGTTAYDQWRRMPNHDQRHSIGVARGVEAELTGTDFADDPRWIAAALLHDIGKLDSRLGVYGRVVATASGAVAGRDMAAAWSERDGFTRRVGLYLRHPELGADRIRLAGGPEEAAAWAAAHHDPERWATTGIPDQVVVALVASDDD
ncbi:MAG TPA: HD domain-containing protein [Acidimicrobiia bacterium]|nr:HD domain-containing protein [Acidimicrobiia bacterium]